jgi:membrane-associated phospholipid phosphatase
MRDSIGRRSFLRVGGAIAAGVASAGIGTGGAATPSSGKAPPPGRSAKGRTTGRERAEAAFRIRVDAAKAHKDRPAPPAKTNGDEDAYPNKIASFSKALPHGALGEVDPRAYAALIKALGSGSPVDFEAVPLGGKLRLVNPQGSFAFGLEGGDSHEFPLAPPPAFSSAERAAEAGELYWQALTRDIPFSQYEGDPQIQRAAADLSKLSAFKGPKEGDRVTPATLFRGQTPGDLVGPYVSQFLWKEVPYGAIRLVQQVRTTTPGLDYLVTGDDWLAAQNGATAQSRHASAYLYVRSARDLAAYVHLDFTYQAFLTACLILFGMQGTTDAQIAYKGAPYDRGNPYRGVARQSGFATFGVGHALDLVARVASDGLKACWYQKWLVHRTLRPEEYGGRVHHHRTAAARYPLHEDILSSAALEAVHARHGTYFLPQAYPEGCPIHPSYPAGHAVIAGACATVLKAFFDEPFPIDDPVVVSADGLRLAPYQGKDLTVGGELNKLASNVAFGRNAAGIHWRSDGIEGLQLGEAVALSVLADTRHCFNEDFGGFLLTKFDGTAVTI